MVSVRVLSFDVWDTILDINKMFSFIASRLAVHIPKVDVAEVLEVIRVVYDKCKLRRRLGEIDGFDIVIESQNMLAERLGIETNKVLEAISDAFASADPKDIIFGDVIDTLELLHRLGFKLGVIGNTVFWSSIYTIDLLKRLGIYNIFEALVFSDETRINKPDRRIFFIFAKKIGEEPKRIAHVGDSVIEDVGGALSAGMKAIHIDRRRGRNKLVLKDLGLALIGEFPQIIEVLEEL
ncbi:MAG: HAD family hydrolase [Ignisphaera sp.]